MVIQRYRATQELGKGSFGTVYLTQGRRDKKTYVVKVIFLAHLCWFLFLMQLILQLILLPTAAFLCRWLTTCEKTT